MAMFVIIIGLEMGTNKKPYTMKNKHPKAFTNLNFVTDFIKNDNSTVDIAT
ncbi:hypothetical protein DFQ02_10176 [Seonamhaeicola aphaedonensis]|uniref:Uncharacterized protein n=1 Tax=Seonamhaeicola aphaedonensis TaxID=1461338 RepID=A0A3D9HMC8_9FLAO|nr:hypothetical protein DFQ02_10176 [Seonamhaeicola aphaedonensis]